jgi:hypothetical protein
LLKITKAALNIKKQAKMQAVYIKKITIKPKNLKIFQK